MMKNLNLLSFNLLMIFVFMLWMSSWVPIKTKDVPGCFPDYRPGFKCFVFEKLP
jgi:hypothetical protein